MFFDRFTPLYTSVLALGTLSFVPATSGGTFFDSFDDGNAAMRFTTSAINNPVANYAYDYSAAGIPSAPNSTGGSTIGLRMAARTTPSDAAGAVAAIRNGMPMSGDYTMTVDMWINYNGGAGGAAARLKWPSGDSTMEPAAS